MKLVPPFQIAGEILGLIHASNKVLVLVSPYVNFKNWGAMKNELRKAVERGVRVEFFMRKNRHEGLPADYWTLKELGITPKLVPNLHAKLYYSENAGIVTSMNLLTSSNLNAIELGLRCENREEIQQLHEYVKKYLLPHVENLVSDQELRSGEPISDLLETQLGFVWQGARCWNVSRNHIRIRAGNIFDVIIDKNTNRLYLGGIISGWESKRCDGFIRKLNKMFPQWEAFLDGEKGCASSIALESKITYSSIDFDQLSYSEKRSVLAIVSDFVPLLLDFKASLESEHYSK
ncbi:hypothetical protein D6779_03510 [Candidatus Parcubacteria bacterium]|nr:MAG: hypothetical protein D6779_03510 [Candidatus Parcubacteria bacterium]